MEESGRASSKRARKRVFCEKLLKSRQDGTGGIRGSLCGKPKKF